MSFDPQSGAAGARWWAVLALLVVAAWASFRFDAFGVVGLDSWRLNAATSEELVFDGILRAGEPGAAGAPLGRYVRDGAPLDSRAKWLAAFEAKDRRTEYRSYLSQYGLQGTLWSTIHYRLGVGFGGLLAINALLVALALGALVEYVRRMLGTAPALLFAATAILAPWMVAFAQSLYWVMWTWLLPMIAAFAFGRRALVDGRGLAVLLAALFATALLKLLCGYEYVTTVLVAASVPVVWYGVRERHPPLRILGRLVAMAVTGTVALAAAMVIHVGSQTGVGKGWDDIRTLVEKRLHSRDPVATARQACAEEFFESPDCEATYAASLTASPITVIARYVAFDDLLPWLPKLEREGAPEAREALREALRSRSIERISAAVSAAGWADVSRLVTRLIDTAAFALLLLLLSIKLWRLRRSRPDVLVAIAFALAAPLSWFVLAKGHSYIHMLMNYVLWYVPFVPLAVAVLAVPSPRVAVASTTPSVVTVGATTRAAGAD